MQTQETPHKAAAPVTQKAGRVAALTPIRELPHDQIVACASFRDAVRLGWKHRADRSMTKKELAAAVGIHPPHMSIMLHRDDLDRHGKPRQDLPHRYIDDFERVVGNHAIYQWLEHKGRLLIVEELLRIQETP